MATYLDRGSVLALERDGIGDEVIANRGGYRSPNVLVDFAKFFMDGVPSMRTASFFDPYKATDEQPAASVEPFYSATELAELVRPLDRDGISVKVHAIGDRAVATVIDAIELVRRTNNFGPLHQIAHMGFIRQADIARMAGLGIVADLGPAMWFPTTGQARLRKFMDPAKVEGSYPIADLLKAGVLACAGTDWPCAAPSPGPWFGLTGVVTRKNPSGKPDGMLNPSRHVDVADALRLFTINPAKAMGLGSVAGSIEVGKSADFIILDRDILSVAPDDIVGTNVLATFFEGRLVHGNQSDFAPRQRH